jgi:hypothetical protein
LETGRLIIELAMEVSLEDQLGDLDWFCVDKAGNIGHFATAGIVPLPRAVAECNEALTALAQYFYERDASTEAIIDPQALLNAGKIGSDPVSQNLFLRDFREMARRGLYSYDAFMRGPSAPEYHRVAVPVIPLPVDALPPAIRELLAAVTFSDIDFKSAGLVSFR